MRDKHRDWKEATDHVVRWDYGGDYWRFIKEMIDNSVGEI